MKRKLNQENDEPPCKKHKQDETLHDSLIRQTKILIGEIMAEVQDWKTIDNNSLWHLFEYEACIQQNVIPWHLVPPHYKTEIGIPIKDYGIDGISLDFVKAVQAKYRKKSSISYRELSTFVTTATFLKAHLFRNLQQNFQLQWKPYRMIHFTIMYAHILPFYQKFQLQIMNLVIMYMLRFVNVQPRLKRWKRRKIR